ncbi:MAG: radical SAM family heme chaperone HemW [Rickettsiales bacterium]|jgi:oxygen-independent coproporphyrinogen-3 oxidase|nr:radical SAM family heme chaperone HemW [Rickettsiales bacterium]
MSSEDFSIYIHYPFCQEKCPYCDFNSYRATDVADDALEKYYLNELKYYRNMTAGRKVGTIFFGGGTPSLAPVGMWENILNAIGTLWNVKRSAEISIEINPASADIKKIALYRKMGINRISIGAQSLNDKDLKFLGRIHSRREALDAIATAKKYFDNYSLDLIYARPGQRSEEWLKELEEASNLSPNHLSLYQLVVAENTEFFRRGVNELDGEKAKIMYERTNNFLLRKNIRMYEVSNYAAPGFECRHNINYWNSGEWLGIGPGSHGRLCPDWNAEDGYKIRLAMENHRSVKKWMDAVEHSGHGARVAERLTREEFQREAVLMGLRMRKGISLAAVKKYLKIDDLDELFLNKKNLDALGRLGYIRTIKNRRAVSLKHFMILDSIVEKVL